MKKLNKVFEAISFVENLDHDFADIIELSRGCKFANCTHTTESNCAVREAISEGVISDERFNVYWRIKNEAAYVSEMKNKTKAVDYMKQKKLFQKV